MGRLGLLIKNVFYFGGLRIISALFPLILYPYITRRLENPADFGIYDIFTVIATLGSSISMLGVQDALFKEYHENENLIFRKLVVSTAFVLVIFSSIFFCCLLILLKGSIQSSFFNNPDQYSILYFVSLFILFSNLMNISVHPSRLINNKKQLLYHTSLFVCLFYLLAIVFLNLQASYLSLIYANLFQVIIISIVFTIIHREILFPLKFSFRVSKRLLRIGLPLVPIFIIYWANNSVIRVLILKYLGEVELGVFSIGSKYAAVSSFIQVAFASGWSYFTFSTMKDNDQAVIKSKVFEALLFFIVIIYLFAVPVSYYLFDFLFEGDYLRGYTVFGQLFLGPLLLVLYQIIANQFTIIGKSYFSLLSLFIGFLFGLVFCFYSIYKEYGIIGISYSIPISYLVSLIISSFFAQKMKIFLLSKNIFLSFFVLILTNIGQLYLIGFQSFIASFIILVIYLSVNYKYILSLWNILKPHLKSLKNG